jgi:hypothetical protein
MGKGSRLSSSYVRGWTGQSYVRKCTARTRRQLERNALREVLAGDHDADFTVPALPAKGYAD